MPVEVGASAPDFVLKDQNNQEVRLSDFRGQRAVRLGGGRRDNHAPQRGEHGGDGAPRA